jgi:hypothetical protein
MPMEGKYIKVEGVDLFIEVMEKCKAPPEVIVDQLKKFCRGERGVETVDAMIILFDYCVG